VGDAFVTHIDAAGQNVLYSTYLGGSSNDLGANIRVDSTGLVYVVGFSDSGDFPVSAGATQKNMAGDGGSAPYFLYGDGFLTVINPGASAPAFSTYFGGSQDDILFGLALDGSGGAWATGSTLSPNLPVTSNAVQKTYGGGGSPTGVDFKGDAMLTHFTNLTTNGPTIIADGTRVVNGGSYLPGNIVSGSWVSIKGSGFTQQTVNWDSYNFSSGTLPSILDGVQVLFNGQPGYIWYLIAGSPQQINVQAPANLSGNVSVQVVVNGTPSNTVTSTALQIAPAIFAYTLDGGTTFYASAVFANGTYLGNPSIFPGAQAAHAGNKVVLYANSIAPSPAGVATVSAPTDPVTVTIGSTTLTADFSGLVAPGEFQINITVPNLGQAGNYPITISIDGKTSQSGILFPYAGS
jgi:uncharacterized protein (TIGR03437 family)